MPPDYKYDLAISFLAQDEELANEIRNLIAGRFQVFVYSKLQESLAGSDGEVSFSRVFSEETRIVAVLYRQNWGKTPWTRIELTALKNRAYDHGYDFCLFIALEEKLNLPEWMPKSRLFFNLERFGLTGAVAVIENMIIQRGGNAQVETAVEIAQRQKRQTDREKDLAQFLSSQAGNAAAWEEVEKLFESIETLINAVNEQRPVNLKISCQRAAERNLNINAPGSKMMIVWFQQFRNSLERSGLKVSQLNFPKSRTDQEEELYWRYDFTRIASGLLAWRDSANPDQYFNSHDLADRFVKLILA